MKTRHDILMEDAEFRRLLAVEALAAGAAELIARLMADQAVSRAEFARRLGKSRAWVTQLLSGKGNLTVKTLAEAAFVLGSELRLESRIMSSKGMRHRTSARKG